MVERVYRIIFGCIILLLVDLIWVVSSELTEYLYHDKKFNKPFFSTYVKTSMFIINFIGFIIWKPWRSQCYDLLTKSSSSNLLNGYDSPLYSVLDQSDQANQDDPNANNINSCGEELEPILSESIWVPVKFNDVSSEKSSGTESDGERVKIKRSKSKVRFSKLSEVRQLSNTEAEEALVARMSYQASLRLHKNVYHQVNKLSINQTSQIAFSFCLLWFAGNLSYQEALNYSQAGVVNVLSSTSSLFTLFLGIIFPSNSPNDRFSLTKLIAVIISIGSVGIISASESQISTNKIPIGALWSLSGAFFYAAYIVIIRYKVSNEDSLDIPMFFGFVGFYCFILLWPGLLLLNYTDLEPFQWPNSEEWAIILVNGLIGTVFSELLWLWGCLLTSSLIASLSITLTIPMTVMFDVLLKEINYPQLFFFGTIPLFISFFIVTFLSQFDNWDPLASILHKLVRHTILRKTVVRMRDSFDREQSQCLINENENV